ncbi:BlaI/MecI/CopY family transcriptional regulator [Planosporangium thailandense]|uniref:BlaI/MecI/CopY family transcriptional regulator n=1 Tax=Planosporangium thailandense TaxID=765197 RepID=A0ABX0Y501_9ACTN|nr:BlaI/MecI/CopY family transcriptional regulator [Planosporangium thailandense]NJC73485.1 BlaI/MecI/CopY family transcriptional regulator [Planosporangium thailandense]
MADLISPTKRQLERDVMAMLAADHRPLTLEQVRERLGGGVMATTVMTVLNRLHEQGLARCEWVGRSYVYIADADRAERTAGRIRALLDADGDRRAVLARLIAMLPPDERLELSDLLRGDYAEAAAAPA